VARVDGAGLQLLAVFIRTARASRVDYRWREPSHALQQAAALLGLSRELELPAS
jgi:ABC-type transporter Mla MlaB component